MRELLSRCDGSKILTVFKLHLVLGHIDDSKLGISTDSEV